MRQQFIAIEDAETIEAAKDIAPWASKIVEVEGGWQAWESLSDYQTWVNQA